MVEIGCITCILGDETVIYVFQSEGDSATSKETDQETTNDIQEEREIETIKESTQEPEQPKETTEESVTSDSEKSQTDSGIASSSQAESEIAGKTEDPPQVNGKDTGKESAQSDDSDTETFEDADVSMGETDIAGGKKERITPDKDSADDSEAFYDMESDEDAKVKETEAE